MGSTGDSLGDYRARAAACRAMAEKAAEFPSETRTWVQIAEMWEGLAERAEAQPAVGTDEVPVPEATDGDATELASAPDPEPSVAVPSDDEGGRAAPPRSPMRRVAVVAGFLLAFTLSLDDLVIARFNTGPGATTLPMRIYSQVRLGVTPEINAVSTILIALVTIGVTAATLATKRGVMRAPGDH